jgi:hypothetical protein
MLFTIAIERIMKAAFFFAYPFSRFIHVIYLSIVDDIFIRTIISSVISIVIDAIRDISLLCKTKLMGFFSYAPEGNASSESLKRVSLERTRVEIFYKKYFSFIFRRNLLINPLQEYITFYFSSAH